MDVGGQGGKSQGLRKKSYFSDAKSNYCIIVETHVGLHVPKHLAMQHLSGKYKTRTNVPRSYARSELNCRLFELQTTQTSCGGFKMIWIASPQVTTILAG